MFDAAVLKDAVVSIIWDENIGVNKPMANLKEACFNCFNTHQKISF